MSFKTLTVVYQGQEADIPFSASMSTRDVEKALELSFDLRGNVPIALRYAGKTFVLSTIPSQLPTMSHLASYSLICSDAYIGGSPGETQRKQPLSYSERALQSPGDGFLEEPKRVSLADDNVLSHKGVYVNDTTGIGYYFSPNGSDVFVLPLGKNRVDAGACAVAVHCIMQHGHDMPNMWRDIMISNAWYRGWLGKVIRGKYWREGRALKLHFTESGLRGRPDMQVGFLIGDCTVFMSGVTPEGELGGEGGEQGERGFSNGYQLVSWDELGRPLGIASEDSSASLDESSRRQLPMSPSML